MSGAKKVSISVDANDLKWLRRRARQRGETLSALFAEATRMLRHQEARDRLLDRFGEDANVSPEEADAIRAEWRG
jgi:hypothetical protein